MLPSYSYKQRGRFSEIVQDLSQRCPRWLVRRRNWVLVLVATCSVLVSIIVLHGNSIADHSSQQWHWTVGRHGDEKTVKLPFAWKYLSQDPLTSFTAEDGNVYELSPDAPLWRNLGKKVLILDVDSRLDTSKGAMLNPDKPTRKTMNKRTGGILNHMLYALMHGYDYRLVRPPSYEDRHGTWVKVPAIKEALKTHDIVVFLDADAIFHYIDLPLEWLMGHWNITTNTLLAAPIDIEEEVNYDSQGQLYWNTGFVIARQSELTQEMFTKWEACPTEEEYEGCSRWLEEWAHEQAAFGNHIRYDYNTDGHLTPIPCNEANGSPDPRGNCRGVFIRHYWHSKEYVVDELYEQISSETVETLHRMFHNDLDQFFVDGSNLTYPLFNGDLVI